MLKQKNGHSPVAAGRMTRVVTCVTNTIYNIVRESVFSNQIPLKSIQLPLVFPLNQFESANYHRLN